MLPKLDVDIGKTFNYDVAISFAGQNRDKAKELANRLNEYHLEVFYDEYEQADLIGKNLYQYLKEIYFVKCRYCIILVSEHYVQRKWPFKVELPATQERDFASDEEYILPVILDDTKIPGIEKTIAHIDLRDHSIEEASELLAHKILKKSYTESALIKRNKGISKKKIAEIEDFSRTYFVSLFSERIFNCSHGEIRVVDIASEIIEDLQFKAALEMYLNKNMKGDRNITLRFYLLDPESITAQHFAELSREPLKTLKQKIYKNQEALTNLITSINGNKKKIRGRIHYYSTVPIIRLYQIDDDYFFRVFYIGEKQGKFSVFYVRGDRSNQFVVMLQNIITELEFNSRTIDINWF